MGKSFAIVNRTCPTHTNWSCLAKPVNLSVNPKHSCAIFSEFLPSTVLTIMLEGQITSGVQAHLYLSDLFHDQLGQLNFERGSYLVIWVH